MEAETGQYEYECSEGYLTVPHDTQIRLYYEHVKPKTEQAKARLVIVHGFGEHTGRWITSAKHFASHGYEIILFDQRGFGYSGGPRLISTFKEYHEDISFLIREKCPTDLPLYLLAHSMGGLVIASFLVNNPNLSLAGVITTGALFTLQVGREVPPFKMFLIRMMKVYLPELVLNSMVNPSSLSKQEDVEQEALEDPRVVGMIGIRQAYDVVLSTSFLIPMADAFSYPALIIHGDCDRVTHPESSIRFHDVITSRDKTLKIISGGYHEMNQDRDQVELW
eukprot:CAMPEP_0114975584 /NCGR_PEP_ID=MMETSP0216-20121206/2188_1 /TAXON_ID=223996 /ORGANISM="Protocruzia adherens, Strain Boccale" /LENGTH=278 /DNA_ID=CAMNT_0002336397 /DNA_START=30 /DNA_END=863 /DNA_ORIENTATION=+